MSLDSLPTELYEAILYHVPSSELQATTLALSRAIPRSGIPLRHLFRSIRITHADQATLLYNSLRPLKLLKSDVNPSHAYQDNRSVLEQTASWIQELSIEAWDVDAEVVINLFHLLKLPKLKTLNIWIGPRNFAPEHLEELVLRPLLSLRHLSLRFRPYVQKATYYQFLKGAYFDSTLTALSQWPPTLLPTLSIVQDPPDSSIAQNRSFAQPLVFFRLDVASLLRSSALSRTLTSLRLRIPLRPVVRSLCTPPTIHDPSVPLPCPRLQFLDLSTSGVLESELEMLLVQFTELNHVILDDCPIFRGDLQEGSWSAFGKRCALVGVKRSKEREKALKAWHEARAMATAGSSTGTNTTTTRRIRPGRSGLATPTISLRGATEPAVVVPVPHPTLLKQIPEESENATSNQAPDISTATVDEEKYKGKGKGKKKKGSKAQGRQKDKSKKNTDNKTIPSSKIRILPALPTLKSLCVTMPSITESNRHSMIRSQFEEGWAEGIAQLGVTRGRLRTSSKNGYRIMRSSNDPSKSNLGQGSDSDSVTDSGDSGTTSNKSAAAEGLFGLEDIDNEDLDAYGMPLNEHGFVFMQSPSLCFGGPRRDGEHTENCGHSIAWGIMLDEL
ncbi:hypothetical protein CPC08DRAFT_703524 [Agrocybe pediades]|nr:hypothetical protein CPC08DRAFT_703524 [Agrocybe pediades]